MAEVLILDSEAVNALANVSRRSAAAQRARAILRVAAEHHAIVRIPAPVLAEVSRGGARDAAIDRLIGSGVAVVDLTRRMAQRAGALLTRHGRDSSDAVDAFVAAGTGPYVAGSINVGSGVGVTIKEAAVHVLAACGSASEITVLPTRAVEVTRFVADITRAKRELGLVSRASPLQELKRLVSDG